MNLSLKNKVVFVSGGSKGLGFAIAQGFASEGAKIAMTARDPENLEIAGDLIKQTAGANNVYTHVADMTDESKIKTTITSIENKLGEIDIVVANVGSGIATLGIDLTKIDWNRSIQTNLIASTLLASAILPNMVKRGTGSLTFISSIAGLEGIKAPIPYSAAKAGLMMAMKNMADEVGSSGVRVNAVAPGNIFYPGGRWADKFKDGSGKRIFTEYIKLEVPMNRFASPKEIADVVVFVSSKRASFMTGSVVVVDGGQTKSYV